MSRTMREELAEFKRASVLKEAARQFYEKGYDGTRIEEIVSDSRCHQAVHLLSLQEQDRVAR